MDEQIMFHILCRLCRLCRLCNRLSQPTNRRFGGGAHSFPLPARSPFPTFRDLFRDERILRRDNKQPAVSSKTETVRFRGIRAPYSVGTQGREHDIHAVIPSTNIEASCGATVCSRPSANKSALVHLPSTNTTRSTPSGCR